MFEGCSKGLRRDKGFFALEALVNPKGCQRVAGGRRGLRGRRPPGNGAGDVLHPGRGARPAAVLTRVDEGPVLAPLRGARSRTRLSGGRSPLALNDHRLPSGNPPGWPRHRMGGGPAALHLCGLMSAVNAGFIVCILASLPRNALGLPDHPFQLFGAGVSAIDLGHAAQIAEQAVGGDFAGVGTRRQPLG